METRKPEIRTAHPSQVDQLISELGHPYHAVRAACREALARLPVTAELLARLRELSASELPYLRLAAMAVLGKMGQAASLDAADVLRAGLQDPHWLVREAAAAAAERVAPELLGEAVYELLEEPVYIPIEAADGFPLDPTPAPPRAAEVLDVGVPLL